MLAHEVRGPVATVKSLAATTLQSYERLNDDERKEFVGLIEQESSRLLDTVTQASLAMKVDAQTVGVDLRQIDVAEVVREAAAALDGTSRPAMARRGAHPGLGQRSEILPRRRSHPRRGASRPDDGLDPDPRSRTGYPAREARGGVRSVRDVAAHGLRGSGRFGPWAVHLPRLDPRTRW
jgi:signal transduction histidine kinase